MNRFAQQLSEQSISLRRGRPEVLQVNVGKLCNLTCVHCHVNAGPKRKEIMTRETVDRIIDWFAKTEIPTVDLTGGAPEMISDFRYFIERVKELKAPSGFGGSQLRPNAQTVLRGSLRIERQP
jgi:MoaA/NifB/PqqE/SkfB family radical SAM enzyme